jgi:hypothetical protein
LVDEEAVFVIGEVAGGIFFFQLDGFGPGGVVLVFLEGEQGFGQTGEGVEHSEVVVGVGLERFLVRAGRNLVKLPGELSDGELEPDEGKRRGVIRASDLEEPVLEVVKLAAAFAVLEVILIAAMKPGVEIGEIEGDALFSHF